MDILIYNCFLCGKEKQVKASKYKGRKPKYCSHSCRGKVESKGRIIKWNGGRIKTIEGYIKILSPNHPYKNCDGRGYVLEHRLVMEKKLGRYLLPTEVIHHINKIRDDNRIENLELHSNPSSHMKKEWKIRKSK